MLTSGIYLHQSKGPGQWLQVLSLSQIFATLKQQNLAIVNGLSTFCTKSLILSLVSNRSCYMANTLFSPRQRVLEKGKFDVL